MKKLWILLALFSAIPIVAQVSKPVPTPVSAAPSTCPIGNLYQITPGHSGAGNIYGNSGTGTTCAIVAGPGGTGVTAVTGYFTASGSWNTDLNMWNPGVGALFPSAIFNQIVNSTGTPSVTGTYTDEGGASFPISVATGVGAFH